MFKVPNELRMTIGRAGSDDSYGNNGVFVFGRLTIIASDGRGWEHVSVSNPKRCPTWDEMNEVKDMFWGTDDCVMQLHPPKYNYVNNHRFCLHLWRPINQVIPQPPKELVGI